MKRKLLIALFIVLITSILLSCSSNENQSGGENIFTLSILPSGLNLKSVHNSPLFDGDVSTTVISKDASILLQPIRLIEILLNYLIAIFINIFDAIFWIFLVIFELISKIPLIGFIGKIVNGFFNKIYSLPDLDLKMGLPHRSIFTHNLIIIGFIYWLFSFKSMKEKSKTYKILGQIIGFIGLIIALHLLADSMPKAWAGSAHIRLLKGMKQFSAFSSKLWLYLNSFIFIAFYGNSFSDENEKADKQESIELSQTQEETTT